MTKFQVTIQKHIIYEVECDSHEDAEELAWNIYDGGDFSEPLCSDILKIEEYNVGYSNKEVL
jgi:hypothetical protein